MKNILSDIVYKYSGIRIKEEENLLDIPIVREFWLYIIIDLEEEYKLPIVTVLDTLPCEDWTLKKITERLMLV